MIEKKEINQMVSLNYVFDLFNKIGLENAYEKLGNSKMYIIDTPYSAYLDLDVNDNVFLMVWQRTDYSEIDMEETCYNVEDFKKYIGYDLYWTINDAE